MLKKVAQVNFTLKNDNHFQEYKDEINSFWIKESSKRSDVFDGDIFSAVDIIEKGEVFNITICQIKFSDLIYSKYVGNIKTRAIFSGGYIITSDNYYCLVLDKTNNINLVGGMACPLDTENGVYNPDICLLREAYEEIGIDINSDKFNYSIKYLKCPNNEENLKNNYSVGTLYEIKTSYTKDELNNIFLNSNHDNEIISLITFKKDDFSKYDGYQKKDYIDELYSLICDE